ncbi:MAG: hypothetical protein HGA22_03485 [Clostridiales bacterium]|nr:hypothetical protein [Clostridiales bacterium]
MDSILMALFGTTVFSAGVVLQKSGSVWMNWKDRFGGRFFSKLAVWLSGMVLSYVVSAAFIGIASRKLAPEMISAITGFNIVVIVLLSFIFLKEKLYATDVAYSAVIVCSIVVMSRFGGGSINFAGGKELLYWLLFLPFLLLIPVFFKFTGRKAKTILLSVFSGLLGGLTIVFMNILMKEAGNSISGIISSPLLYIYFVSGVVSVTAKQVAYRLGDVILITPFQTSFSMVYPLLCSYMLFSREMPGIQVLAAGLIALSCWKIQKKR